MQFEGRARKVTDFFIFSAIPSQPGSPEATAVGKEHVIIEWLKPESDGGSELKNYIVDKREKSSTRWGQQHHWSEKQIISLHVYLFPTVTYALSCSELCFYVSQVDTGQQDLHHL